MLQNPRLNVQLEQDPDGPYPYLTRAEQRRVEQQMETAIKAVIPKQLISGWMGLPNQLFVTVDGGQKVELDPNDESMSLRNLRLFLDQTLARSNADMAEPLSTNPETPVDPVCKIKVGGQHEDGAHCRLLILATLQGGGTARLPWIVSGSTHSGVVVNAWVGILFSWTTDSPRTDDAPKPAY